MRIIRLLGTVLVGCMCLAVTAQAQWPLGKDAAQALQKKDETPTVTATGRFQIFVSPNHKGHTFMLDTDSGKMWLMKKDSLSGNFSMDRVPVEQVDKEWKPPKGKEREASESK